MLNLKVIVTYRDGTTKTETTAPKDEVALERTYNVGIAELVERGPGGGLQLGQVRVEFLYFLAWSALSRTQQEIRDFDSFLDVISDLDFGADEETGGIGETPDPTQAGAPPA